MKANLIFYAAACAVLAAACDKNGKEEAVRLQAPVIELAGTTANSFRVVWDAVEGADSYGYEFDGIQGSTELTELEFSDLVSDTVYSLKVKSMAGQPAIESEWAEISVSLNSEGVQTVDFNLEAAADGMNIVVSTSPSDKEFPYYLEPVPASMYEAAGSDAAVLFGSMMEEFGVYFGSPSSAFDEIHMTGDKELRYDISKYAEEKFYVVIGGIDDDLNVTTAVECVEVDIELPSSDNEFDVTIAEVGQARIVVSVTPLNDDTYSIILQDKKTVDGMSEAQLRSFISGLVSENSLCTGKTTMIYEKNIVPSHDYTVLVFGWEGTFTTEISRTDVRTLDPEEVDELTFDFSVDVNGPTDATVEVVPSNLNAVYFYDVISMSDYMEKYQSDFTNYIAKMAENMNRTPAQYLNLFGSVGIQSYDYDSFVLTPGTEFVLFALGYTINDDGSVTYLNPQYMTFSTPEE